jgi:hypothetical protein
MIWGLLEVYETTFEAKYLSSAISLNEYVLRHFWNDKYGGFYFTADDAENFLVRNREIYDGAYPSGTSVETMNLLRLARMTGRNDLEEKAWQTVNSISSIVTRSPKNHIQLMVALDFALGPSYEVVIVGSPKAENTEIMLKTLREFYVPRKVVLFRTSEIELPEIVHLAEFTKNLTSKERAATAYVCQNYKCNLPTTSISKMLELLNTNA